MRSSPLLAALVLAASLAAPALAAHLEPRLPGSSLAAAPGQSLAREPVAGFQGALQQPPARGDRAALAGVPGPQTLALLGMGLLGLAVAGTPRRGH